jgi:hypothetical protein
MDIQLIEWLKEDIKSIRDELKLLDGKVDQLLAFKYRIIGGTIIASLVLTTIFQIVIALLHNK